MFEIKDTGGNTRPLRADEQEALYELKKRYFKIAGQKDGEEFETTFTPKGKEEVVLRAQRNSTEAGNPLEFQMQGYKDKTKFKTFLTPKEVHVYNRSKGFWRMATASEASGYYEMLTKLDVDKVTTLVIKKLTFTAVSKDCIFCGENFMVSADSPRKLPTANIYDKSKRSKKPHWRPATEPEASGYYKIITKLDVKHTKLKLYFEGLTFTAISKDCIFCGENYMVSAGSPRELPTAFIGLKIKIGEKEGCLVVLQNRKGGKWMMPGGLVDPTDTSLYAAARRELREESGFDFFGRHPSPSAVYDKNFFVLNSETYGMSKDIFEQKKDDEAVDFGVAYVNGKGKWTVLSSKNIRTVLTREIVRGGTFNQLKKFSGRTVAAGFADRTLFD